MRIVALLLLAVILIAGIGGCNRKVSMRDEENITKNMNDLEKLSGLKLPASARIISATGEGGHDGTKYKRWIVASSERPTLLGTAIEGDDNKTFVKTLKEAAPDEDFGAPVGDKYQFSDWRNEQGQWQAATVETDKGFYSSVESVVLD